MSKILNIATYQPKPQDSFFVDANIWVLLCYPMGNHRQDIARSYSAFINSALKAGSHLYTSGQVLSEFVNRCIDFEFKHKIPEWRSKNKKRDFLKTTLYLESLSDVILPGIDQISKMAARCPDHFDTCDFEKVLQELEIIDFNDACHLQIVRKNNWILLTNDGDFGNVNDSNLVIATALPTLLKAV